MLKEPLSVKMNQRTRLFSILAVAVFLIVSNVPAASRLSAQTAQPRVPQRTNQTVIFAIGGESGYYHMDAVAVGNGKQILFALRGGPKRKKKKVAGKIFPPRR